MLFLVSHLGIKWHGCQIVFSYPVSLMPFKTAKTGVESNFLMRFLFSATEYHLGLLKAKLAKYRAQLLEPSKSAGAKGEGFDVMKSGDARVALIGFPSVGKVSVIFWNYVFHYRFVQFNLSFNEMHVFPAFNILKFIFSVFSLLVLIMYHRDSYTKYFQSTFLSLMTSTESEAASYEFTTLTCIPGVIEVSKK